MYAEYKEQKMGHPISLELIWPWCLFLKNKNTIACLLLIFERECFLDFKQNNALSTFKCTKELANRCKYTTYQNQKVINKYADGM